MRVSSTAPLPLPASHCGTMDTWEKQNHVPHSHPQSRCPGQLIAPSILPPPPPPSVCFPPFRTRPPATSEGWKSLLPLRSCCASLCASHWRSAATLRNLIPPTLMVQSIIRTPVKLVRYWSVFSLYFHFSAPFSLLRHPPLFKWFYLILSDSMEAKRLLTRND